MTDMAPSTAARQPAGPTNRPMRWITTWTRAVVVPASRRADGATLGAVLIAAVVFGPTAMRPHDLTGLALANPAVGAVLAVTWLLIFVPTARMIVRPPVGYLYSLPGDPRAARAVAAAALILLQLPWVILWIAGEGARGALVVLATTALAAGIARLPAPHLRATTPAWRRPATALAAIHLRALARRAGDALVRGAGLALLAGAAAGLLVRNNQLTGVRAGTLAAAVIAVAAVPAQLGTALVTLGAHRETAWLAAATGISRAARLAALTCALAAVHLAAAALAAAAAMAVAGPTPWLPALALATALGTALGQARVLLAAEASPTAPTRIGIGAIVGAAVAVICLATLGALGAVALIAIAAAALVRAL
jgi:hypothetical protein